MPDNVAVATPPDAPIAPVVAAVAPDPQPVVPQPVVAASSEPSPVVPAPQPVVDATPPPAPQAPVLTPEMREYVTRLEQQSRQAEAQAEEQAVQQNVAAKAKQLEDQGVTAEVAQSIAADMGRQARLALQQEKFRVGQRNAAIAIAEEYGISPRILADLPSVEAMRATAQTATAQGRFAAENAALKAQIADLQKKLAPPQTMASGAVAANGSSADTTWRQFGRGEIPWSPQVQAAGKALGAI